MEEKDLNEVMRLYKIACQKWNIHFVFTKEQLAHQLLPKENIVTTYVVEDPNQKGKLTDFMSFTWFFQQCLSNAEVSHGHEYMSEGQMYYYSFTKNTYEMMIKRAMWLVKEEMNADSLSIFGIMGHDHDYL